VADIDQKDAKNMIYENLINKSTSYPSANPYHIVNAALEKIRETNPDLNMKNMFFDLIIECDFYQTKKIKLLTDDERDAFFYDETYHNPGQVPAPEFEANKTHKLGRLYLRIYKIANTNDIRFYSNMPMNKGMNRR
jgi:hypothetical protein